MTINEEKQQIRTALRKARREHVAAQPDSIRALLFNRPPAPLLSAMEPDAVIGLYLETESEAPASAYAKFFHERGHRLALPYLAQRDSNMDFREHSDPFGHNDLSAGPFGMLQPNGDAAEMTPDVLFVPLIGFTEDKQRLGQGGGHYDRWLATHPPKLAIGLAWDVQLCAQLPVEAHDMPLDAIVTPTRLYGQF